ncbi:MAG TPA: CBS domain-containing protein, partial [Gammaproteobacteria bacterium]
TEEDFARSHPAGSLGRRLLLRIEDLMHTGDAVPRVSESATLSEALLEMSRKGLGMTTVVNEAGRISGIFTDGDLRRLLDHGEVQIRKLCVSEVMQRHCTTVESHLLAAEALRIMDDKRINALPVTDTEGLLVGALNMHDMLRAGVV